MPRPNSADVTVVLDRSGSMATIADDTVGGFNRFLEDQKAVPGECRLTLVQFDTEYEFVHRAVPIADVPPLTRETFVPRGRTALLDAEGRAMAETGARLAAMPEGDRPSVVIVVVVTDGLENSSREYSAGKVAEMIAHQRSAYSWQFLFLGANQDAVATAKGMNIPQGMALTCAANSRGVKGLYAAASRNVHAARTRGVVGFSDEERAEQVAALEEHLKAGRS